MISVPDDLPDDPVALKQLLAQLLAERTVDRDHIVDLKEQIKLWRDRFFGRKSEQTVDPNTPQLPMFDEAENESLLAVVDDADEDVVAPVKRRGQRKPLGSEARSTPLTRSTEPPAPSRPGNARDGFACAYRRTRNRKSSSDSWDGGLVEGSWTEGYFSTGQVACADLIGESLE